MTDLAPWDGDLDVDGLEHVKQSTWWPVDLTDALNGTGTPPPEILHRTDGRAMLYRGRTHAFIGESESCKTWAALLAATEVLAAGGHVLFVDYEDDENGVVSRLRALGVPADTVRTRLHYVHPEESLEQHGLATVGSIALGLVLHTYPITLAIIDGVTEGMTTEGLEPLGTGDAAVFQRRIAKRIAAAPSAPAVVSLDHVGRDAENRGRYALGSQHKISGLTGAAYTFEARRPLHRDHFEQVDAEIIVKVGKDRPGHVREGNAKHATWARLELTAYPDGGVTGRVVPVTDDNVPHAAMLAWIRDHLTVYAGDSVNKMHEASGKRDKQALSDALKWLAGKGYVSVVDGPNRRKLHTLTEAGCDYLANL